MFLHDTLPDRTSAKDTSYIILLKNSSHPEDLAAALPIVSLSMAAENIVGDLAEKLEPSGVIRLTIGRAAARSSGWLEFFSKMILPNREKTS